jgi:hypothetical protein
MLARHTEVRFDLCQRRKSLPSGGERRVVERQPDLLPLVGARDLKGAGLPGGRRPLTTAVGAGQALPRKSRLFEAGGFPGRL